MKRYYGDNFLSIFVVERKRRESMKREICFFILSILFLSSGCSREGKVSNETVIASDEITKSTLVPDKRLFEMRIFPDTFYVTVGRIRPVIINHSSDTATFNGNLSLEYYNQSTTSWEDVLPPNLVSTFVLRRILPRSEYDYDVSLFNNDTPGKYRVILGLFTPLQSNTVIGEFVLSTDSRYKNK